VGFREFLEDYDPQLVVQKHTTSKLTPDHDDPDHHGHHGKFDVKSLKKNGGKAYFQWLKSGSESDAQPHGNQLTIMQLNTENFNKHFRIEGHAMLGSFKDFRKRYAERVKVDNPNVRLYAFHNKIHKQDGTHKIERNVSHDLNELLPQSHQKKWVKQVNKFDLPKAKNWGKTHDRDIYNYVDTSERKPA